MARIIQRIKRVFTGEKECLLCTEDATTNHGLCEECFNDMMDEKHADYVRDLREIYA